MYTRAPRFFRALATILVVVPLSVAPAAAQTIAAAATAAASESDQVLTSTQPLVRESPRRTTADKLLVPAYSALIGLQALDAHSTLRALDAGYREANPVMGWLSGSPTAMIAAKAASTVGTIFISERIRKEHPKRALILVAAIDGAYAAIVAHNYRMVGR